MTTANPFRDVLHVSQERIARMDEKELGELMRQLLCAQAYRARAEAGKVIVSTEDKAKDDGGDGWSPKPAHDDPWLGFVETCWQFKAGKAGQPAKLAGEVTKPIPQKTLRAGGRFVLVASGSVQGPKGEKDRLKKLVLDASASSLPTSSIDVIGSERLTH